MLKINQSCEAHNCEELFGNLPALGGEFQCKEILGDGVDGWLDDQQITTILKHITRRHDTWSIIHPTNFYLNCIQCIKEFIDVRIIGGYEVVISPISTGSHWILVIVTKERVLYYNSDKVPASEPAPEPALSLLNILRPRYVTLTPENGFPKQNDTFNCGIHLLKAVESLVTDTRWYPEITSPRECRRQFVEMLAKKYQCLLGPRPVQDEDLNLMFQRSNRNGKNIKESIHASRLLFGAVKSADLVRSSTSVRAKDRSCKTVLALKKIRVTLVQPMQVKWTEISAIGSEMKIDGQRRIMFPYLAYDVYNLDKNTLYLIKLLLEPESDRPRYLRRKVKREKEVPGTITYKKKVMLGKHLMRKGISFEKLGIWDNKNATKQKTVTLNVNTSYQPILEVYVFREPPYPPTLVSTTIIEETKFTTKCSYNAANVAIRRKWQGVPDNTNIRSPERKSNSPMVREVVEKENACEAHKTDEEECQSCPAKFQKLVDEMDEKIQKYKVRKDMREKTNLWLAAAYARDQEKLAQLEKDHNS